MLHLQFVRARTVASIHGPLRLYLQFAYVEGIYWQSPEDVTYMNTSERASARAHAYTYVCARGLPAYFGILIARGRPSPLLTPSPPRSSPHLAPPRILPRPCTPTPPSGYPSPSPRVSPSRRHPSRKPFVATSSRIRIFTCGDNNVRGVSHMDMYFSTAV